MTKKHDNIFDVIKKGQIINYISTHIFSIIKIITILIHLNIKCFEKYNYIFININILEAVFSDIIENDDLLNGLFGFSLILLYPIMNHLLDSNGIKIWCILYFIWNIKFCKNKKYSKIQTYAHNIPPLYKTLFSFGYTADELLNNWCYLREACIMTSIILYNE